MGGVWTKAQDSSAAEDLKSIPDRLKQPAPAAGSVTVGYDPATGPKETPERKSPFPEAVQNVIKQKYPDDGGVTMGTPVALQKKDEKNEG